MQTEFDTIAGRWAKHRTILNDAGLSSPAQTQTMLGFYAGFAAALEAFMEVADLPENEAVRMMDALQREMKQFETMLVEVTKKLKK